MNDAATLMHIGGLGLAACCAIALPVWAASVPMRDVSIVDSAWSLLVLAPALVAAALALGWAVITPLLLLLARRWEGR